MSYSSILIKLFFICLLDMLSYAMFSPIMVFSFLKGALSLTNALTGSRHLLLGIFLSSYSMAQFISSPFWSKIALKRGKKIVLIYSIFGGCIGYICCFLGIKYRFLWALFIGSSIAGLTGSNTIMVHSYICQLTPKPLWSRYYSFLGVITGVAFIAGPLISSKILGDTPSHTNSLDILKLCLLFSVTNLIIVFLGIKNPTEVQQVSAEKTYKLFPSFRSYNLSTEIKFIFAFLFFLNIGWYSFIKFFQAHLYEYYSFNESLCCKATSILGAICATWQILRTIMSTIFFDKKKWLSYGSSIMLLASIIHLFSTNRWSTLISIILFSFAYSTLIPSILTRIFKLEDYSPKEFRASIYQCTQAASKILAPLLTGALASFCSISPALICTYSLALCATLPVIESLYFKKHKQLRI
jgi:MFS family permease